jgi:glycosyltransferase involved in cell wall biosynthesis
MKKILLISEVYKRGGAGNASFHLLEFLRENTFDARLLSPYQKEKKNYIYSYYNSLTIFSYYFFKFLLRILSFFISNNKFYSFNNIFQISFFSSKKIKKLINNFKPDYVIILWYEYILNYREILKIKNTLNVKIIIYSFDMFAFTGGCRYVQSCENFKKSCRNCPAVKLTHRPGINYSINKYYINKIRPIFFFPSTFSLNFANDTKIIDKQVKKIFYYPFNDYSYFKYNKSHKNSPLIKNIMYYKKKKKYKKIIFFGAQNSNEWRKGFSTINNFIKIFKIRYPKTYNSTLFIFFGKFSRYEVKKLDNNFFTSNFVNYYDLQMVYNISDLIFVPSLQEWSSLILLENFNRKFIICFNTGSSKDYIINNINGYIIDFSDCTIFLDNLNQYLNNKNFKFFNHKMRKKNDVYFSNKFTKNRKKFINYFRN